MAAPYNLAWLRLKHNEAICARLALLGERVDGPTLASLGVAHAAVDDTKVLEQATALAQQLASYPNQAAARIKRSLRHTIDVDMDTYFDRAWAAAAGGARPPPKHT
jgi:enoyl-CoA hydratase/carnithine racemase